MAFVHLHTHSEFSLLDGANRLPELVQHVKKLGMDSLAVTDHGNLHGAWTFYETAKAAKIRPILGFEAYLAFGPRQAQQKPSWAPANYSHLVLLAQNRTGYRNLIRLSSIGYKEGFYRRPRIDREVLDQHREGIICLAACLSGEIALWLRAGRYEDAKATAQYFASTFPGRFWLEIQAHGIPEERLVSEGMLQLSRELGLGVVATNDAHYLRREDAEAHDVLLAIGTGADLDDPKRFRFTGQESYVKSEAEMRQLFPDHLDALSATQTVADLCEFDFEKRYFLPEFPRPAEFATDEALLERLAREGAIVRYGDPLPPAVEERLTYELSVISTAGYAGYFLIVEDFIRAARDRGIPVGPGRGSAAGSLVAYALRITDVDPLRFDLLFERFLNPERVSMPDIDIDFCFERRGEVIEYVRERYGRDSVGQIITFGTMKARAAVRDVGRVLKVPPGEVDRLTKLIPSGPAYNLPIAEAVQKIAELRELVASNPVYQRLVNLASRIEGLSRHASVHAAGVVIAPGPLDEYVPVCTAPTKGSGAGSDGEDAIICQYDMVALEKVGMLKMDLLGLKTLTVIHDTVAMIVARGGEAPDLASQSFDDPAVYEMLRKGRTAGVFQFESPLATETLRSLKCDRFDDLVACNALLRPGPLDAGMHTVFIKRKLGQEKVSYPHPLLEEVLEPTYGVITYQEQVMRIANVMAGFSLAEADVLRKAVGKKDADLIKKELTKFVERGLAQGHPKKLMDELSAQIETFGRYGFNKSHSVAYSVLSYQTAWLKVHYPAEFMAALLSSEIGDTDTVVQYINEARDLGMEVLPPGRQRIGLQVHGGESHADPLRAGRGAERGPGRHRVDHRRTPGGAIRHARRPRRPARPPARQSPGIRVPDRGRRLRFAGGASRAAAGRCGPGARRGRPQAAGARRGPGIALRRGLPGAPGARAAGAGAGVARSGAARPGERGARVLHLRASAGEIPSRGGALQHPDHRNALPLERAPGDARGRHHGGQAADLQEDREGIRANHGRGLPRDRGGDRVPGSVGAAEPDHPPRSGDAPDRGILCPGPGRGRGALRRRGRPAARRAPEDRLARARVPVERPQRRDRRPDPLGGRPLRGSSRRCPGLY